MIRKSLLLGLVLPFLLLTFENCAPAPSSEGGSLQQKSVAVEYLDISLTVAPGSLGKVAEGSAATLRAEIPAPQPVDLALDVFLREGTAKVDIDVHLPVSRVVIPAGETFIDFSVAAISDEVVEDDESVSVVAKYEDKPIESPEVELTIEDATPLPTLTLTPFTIQEGLSGDLVARLSRPIEAEVSFDLVSVAGTATEGVDYEKVMHHVSIPAGTVSVRVPVFTAEDGDVEANETLSLEIGNVVHALAPVTSALVTISDKTVLPTISVTAPTVDEGKVFKFTVNLSAALVYPVTLKFETIDGTALAGVNYVAKAGSLTIPAGSKTIAVNIQGKDDKVFQPALAFKLRLFEIKNHPADVVTAGMFKEITVCDGLNKITFSSVFQKDMILHESQPRIWGTARPSTDVEVSLEGRADTVVKVKSDAQGKWMVTIPSKKIAAGVTQIMAKNVCETKAIAGVQVGEVWICSGQSNMELEVKDITTKAEVVADVATATVKNNIRFFNVSHATAAAPRLEFPAPSGEAHAWMIPSPTNVLGMSGVCYHFARELLNKLNKPIGIIDSTFGGTRIEAWTSADVLPEKYRIVSAATPTLNTAVLYNGMIAPFGAMKISGVTWYQGESNMSDAGHYAELQKYLFASWRKQFMSSVLDFHVVQLAGYQTLEVPTKDALVPAQPNKFAEIRQAQAEAAAADAHVGLATAIGTTSAAETAANDIHPKNKKVVGERLARVALSKTYGGAETQAMWVPKSAFDTAGSVLIPVRYPAGITKPAVGLALMGFQLRLPSQAFVYATSAKVKSVDAASGLVLIEVSSTQVKDPTEVRFEYAANPAIGLATKPNGDPLLPLCLKKTGANWDMCNQSLP